MAGRSHTSYAFFLSHTSVLSNWCFLRWDSFAIHLVDKPCVFISPIYLMPVCAWRCTTITDTSGSNYLKNSSYLFSRQKMPHHSHIMITRLCCYSNIRKLNSWCVRHVRPATAALHAGFLRNAYAVLSPDLSPDDLFSQPRYGKNQHCTLSIFS